MSQDPLNKNTCEVCHQSFGSQDELQNHQDSAHGENTPGDRRANYDIETDRPNERKIA
jgi:hypothetical protein